MAKIINSYIRGLDRDTSISKTDKKSLYYNQNFRIVTQENNTTGEMTLVKGNSPIECSNTYYHTGYKIIGNISIRNDIVLFWAEDNSLNDSLTTNCFIDVLINKEDNTYIKIELWSGIGLNFRINKPISAVYRYENNAVRKVYFTDNNNLIRFINIAPDIDDSTDEVLDDTVQANYTRVNNQVKDKFNFIQNIPLSSIQLSKYLSGGDLLSGTYMYAYRLYSTNGSQSNFSPFSEGIPLTDSSERISSEKYYGTDKTTYCNKSIEIKLDLNTTIYKYDSIEIIRLLYEDNTSEPTINVISRQNIESSNRELTFLDSSNDFLLDSYTLEEVVIQQSNYIAKTIEMKDDRLFAGNIKEDFFDVDYDARSYRFNSDTGQSRIYNLNGNSYILNGDGSWNFPATGESGTDWSIPEDADCINYYNINGNETIPSYQYNKNFLSSVYGGSGKNIDYRFASNSYNSSTLDITITKDKPYYNFKTYISSGSNIYQDDYFHGRKKTWCRGEVYRFGIVFINNKGQRSYTKWIGDIRIPDVGASGESSPELTLIQSNEVRAKNIYPQFTVSNIPENDDGTDMSYQLVYVERTFSNKGVLCKGIASGLTKYYDDETYSVILPGTAASSIPYSGGGSKVVDKSYLSFYSPEIDYLNYKIDNSYELKVEGKYVDSRDNYNVIKQAEDGITLVATKTAAINNVNVDTSNIRYLEITDVYNHYYSNDYNVIDETTIDDTFTLRSAFLPNRVTSSSAPEETKKLCSTTILKCFLPDQVTTTDNPVYCSIVLSDNSSQYGGFTYEARQNNTYIPAGDINDTSPDWGDIMICYADKLAGTVHNDSGDSEGYPESGTSYALYYPVETSINLNLQHSDSINKITNNGYAHMLQEKDNDIVKRFNGDSLVVGWSDLYLYNSAYSVNHKDQYNFPKPNNIYNFRNDTLVKYTDEKINGEEIDSWTSFKPNDFNQADSEYKEINLLKVFRDTMLCFQDNGVSILSINPRVTQVGEDGVTTVLGKGDVIDRFIYLAEDVGLQGYNEVIKTPNGLYWVDINKKRIYRYNGKIEPISDTKRINSTCINQIDSYSKITGGYDYDNNEVIIGVTNKDSNNNDFNNNIFNVSEIVTGVVYLLRGDNLKSLELQNDLSYYTNSSPNGEKENPFTVTSFNENYIAVQMNELPENGIINLSQFLTESNTFNIVFNEKLDVFQGYYTFEANNFINTHDKLFTSDKGVYLYEHNKGKYGVFYSDNQEEKQFCYFDILITLDGLTQIEANNIEFYSEVNLYGENIKNETLKQIKAFNKYQQSDLIGLYPLSNTRTIIDTSGYAIESASTFNTLCNIRKNVEHWRLQVPRFDSNEDINNPTSDRFRSNYIRLRFYYNPDNEDKSFSMQDVVTTVQESIL